MNEKTSKKSSLERVTVYIDGFNLYFGLIQAGFERFKWLDLTKLVNNLLKPNQELVEIKYFTSHVSNNPEKVKRQNTFIEALESVGVKIFYGKYQSIPIECKRCGNIRMSFNEKMTDVNIATQMLIDGFDDKYDMAMLISGDSDLVPPIKVIHKKYSNKRVFVIFPPKRYNNSISLVAKGSMVLGRKKIADSQFPEEVKKKDGFVLKKPVEW